MRNNISSPDAAQFSHEVLDLVLRYATSGLTKLQVAKVLALTAVAALETEIEQAPTPETIKAFAISKLLDRALEDIPMPGQ